jgi:type II secretory pathway pseudopilin PulG
MLNKHTVSRRHIVGLTLLETLIVLSILAMVAALLAPVVLPSASSQLKHNTSLLLSALRETRFMRCDSKRLPTY